MKLILRIKYQKTYLYLCKIFNSKSQLQNTMIQPLRDCSLFRYAHVGCEIARLYFNIFFQTSVGFHEA